MIEKYHSKSGRENHSLVEPPFLYGLNLVRKMLEGRGIPHAVYGGAGAQIYIAKAIAGNKPIDSVDSVYELTRKTSDYDIAIPEEVEDAEVEAAVHAFVCKYKYWDKIFEDVSGDYIFQTRLERSGARRLVLAIRGVYAFGISEEESKIHITFDKDKPHHTEMAISGSSETVKLTHSRVGEVAIKVAPIEYILAGKLGRGNPKDVVDSFRLVSLYPSMDFPGVETIAKRMSETEKGDSNEFAGHLDKGAESLLAYLEGRLADLET